MTVVEVVEKRVAEVGLDGRKGFLEEKAGERDLLFERLRIRQGAVYEVDNIDTRISPRLYKGLKFLSLSSLMFPSVSQPQ